MSIPEVTLNGTHSPETPSLPSFHDTIQDLAAKAKASLPRCGERIDKAVQQLD